MRVRQNGRTIFPKFRGENEKCVKPPARGMNCLSSCYCLSLLTVTVAPQPSNLLKSCTSLAQIHKISYIRTTGNMKVFSPAFLGEITPKNEGNVGFHGSSYLLLSTYQVIQAVTFLTPDRWRSLNLGKDHG